MIELSSLKLSHYEVGMGLRLSPEYLRIISHCHEALKEIVMAWLQGRYDVQKFGQPTWRMLVEAVDCFTGGSNHRLAK